MRLVIDISSGLYANLDRIKNGSIACQNILNAVKNGENYAIYVSEHKPKGKWIDTGLATILYCSECGAGTMFKSPCCPFCGARLEDEEMSGGEKE